MLRNDYLNTNTVDGYSIVDTVQMRNSTDKVRVKGVIDDTEGCGAIDTLPLIPHTTNLDLGGGAFDSVTLYLLTQYQIKSYVYDPFNRSEAHNRETLQIIEQEPVDTVTSHSVLNVILDKSEREKHITLAYQALRQGGTAFFKVWRGTGDAIASQSQSNKDALHYFGEICDVFGENNLFMPQDDIGNTIIAKKY
jgi:hypothetical protein